MDEALSKIFNAATGVWAIFCAIVVALFKAWPAIMGRFNERRRDQAAEEEGDWIRLREEIARLHAIIEQRDEKIAVLQQQNFDLQARAMTAEAEIVARDKVAQRLTVLPGAEGVADAAAKRDGDGK